MINRRVSLFYRYPLEASHHMVCPCTLYGVCVVCPGTSELVGQQHHVFCIMFVALVTCCACGKTWNCAHEKRSAWTLRKTWVCKLFPKQALLNLQQSDDLCRDMKISTLSDFKGSCLLLHLALFDFPLLLHKDVHHSSIFLVLSTFYTFSTASSDITISIEVNPIFLQWLKTLVWSVFRDMLQDSVPSCSAN